ncbi:MAG: SagB/ThcOx family dehydrogenase [Deltaproteobacteria bacterium]|nr:SagB/ThcOx family dehydrogenase [Deltaproteobacteria bacterium]
MITSCEQYHEESSYDRHRMSGHFLDWASQPAVFKAYQGIEPLEMPRDVALPKRPFSSLLKEKAGKGGSIGDIKGLSRILLLTNTLTARARHPDEHFYYRSAASAGALYPTEIYVVIQGVTGLDDGLHHFAIHRHGLHPLRQGDFTTPILGMMQAREGRIPQVTFFLTAIFFRSAWKYRTRAYRYHLLDTGHVLEDLMLALKGEGLPAALSYDFDDRAVNRFLGVDEKREGALALVHVFDPSPSRGGEGGKTTELPEAIRRASVVSAREVEYPAIRQMHEAASQIVKGLLPETRMVHELGLEVESWTKIRDLPAWPEKLEYPDALFQRRSKRNFVDKAITGDQMSAFIETVCAGEGRDATPKYDSSLAIGLLVGSVDGIEQGFYVLDHTCREIGVIAKGSFEGKMAQVCLDQMWLANAGAHFLFLTNLDMLSSTWGPRGYRYAMLTAGRLGQRLYVAATAMGLGCCGIGAFYDGEARELLGLNEGSRLLYLVAVGPVKKL